nr:MAG TPA_asm: hypothetical protein [Caudoviricetes sp.]
MRFSILDKLYLLSRLVVLVARRTVQSACLDCQ